MSKNLNNFGFVEELWLLGASKKTISKMTKLPIEQVERIIYNIEKTRKTLADQNKKPCPTVGRQEKYGY